MIYLITFLSDMLLRRGRGLQMLFGIKLRQVPGPKLYKGGPCIWLVRFEQRSPEVDLNHACALTRNNGCGCG